MGRPRKKPSEKEESAVASGKVKRKVAKPKATPKATRSRKPVKEESIVREEILSSEESDWEEVPHAKPLIDVDVESVEQTISSQAKQPVEVVIDAGTLASKDKKTIDLAKALQRALNREKSEYQKNFHKVHLLCFIAHGMFINEQCNDETVEAVMLSLLPTGFAQIQAKTLSLTVLTKLSKWFCSAFPITDREVVAQTTADYWSVRLMSAMESKSAADVKEAAMLFVATLRSLKLDVRLVMSIHPVAIKPQSMTKVVTNGKKKVSPKAKQPIDVDLPSTSKGTGNPREQRERITIERLKEFAFTKASKNGQQSSKPSTSRLPRKAKCSKAKVDDSESESDNSLEERPKRKQVIKKPIKMVEQEVSKSAVGEEDISPKKQKLGRDCWVEVYLKTEQRWICVDCVDGTLDKPDVLEAQANQPVSYVFSFDNDSAVKDLIFRYSSRFSSVRLLRADQDWIKETLKPYASKQHKREKAEDLQIHKCLIDQPLPGSLNDLRNHPFFCAKRDLKKYEAIYPADAKSVGIVRGEPIYLRGDVYTLHSRESWIKEARVIRVGEEPYKVVKARPKMGVPKEMQADRPLPLYGFWQTETFEPPIAVDGKVPRNEYGNVELYKPSMLPVGTVHLPIPGLLTVAKKLNIDCAPAVVGWEFHGMGSHPVLEGFVVCEEHKETLLAAWDHYEAIQVDREAEKRTQRAIKNWTKITKSLLIRRKLTEKFKYGKTNVHLGVHNGETLESDKPVEQNEADQEEAESIATAWPRPKKNFTFESSDDDE